jgi:hypothetical protein
MNLVKSPSQWINAKPNVNMQSFPSVGALASERSWGHSPPDYVNNGALGAGGLTYFLGQAFGKKKVASKKPKANPNRFKSGVVRVGRDGRRYKTKGKKGKKRWVLAK